MIKKKGLPPSPKNDQMCSQNSFPRFFFGENTVFFEKIDE